MGTTASAIARLERGGASPTFSTVERLAVAVGVELRLEAAGETHTPAVRFGVALQAG